MMGSADNSIYCGVDVEIHEYEYDDDVVDDDVMMWMLMMIM